MAPRIRRHHPARSRPHRRRRRHRRRIPMGHLRRRIHTEKKTLWRSKIRQNRIGRRVSRLNPRRHRVTARPHGIQSRNGEKTPRHSVQRHSAPAKPPFRLLVHPPTRHRRLDGPRRRDHPTRIRRFHPSRFIKMPVRNHLARQTTPIRPLKSRQIISHHNMTARRHHRPRRKNIVNPITESPPPKLDRRRSVIQKLHKLRLQRVRVSIAMNLVDDNARRGTHRQQAQQNRKKSIHQDSEIGDTLRKIPGPVSSGQH